MTTLLPDPRQYLGNAASPESNDLHQLANALLGEREPGGLVRREAELDAALTSLLNTASDALLKETQQTAPSAISAKLLHDRLNQILALPAAASGQQVIAFAIPIVLVTGARVPLTLPARLPDIDAVIALLRQHQVLTADADVYLSAQLLAPNTLADVKPSQLWRWKSALQYASRGLPTSLEAEPIKLDGEAVVLRYLVGAVMQPAQGAPALALSQPNPAWALAFSRVLGEQLKHEALTLFPLPRSPLPWLAAQQDGRRAQMEVRFQVFASNSLRKLRQNGETPVAVFSTHENGELRVTLGDQVNGERWDGFVWPLAASDNLAAIQHDMVDLLRECHHDAVRFVPQVLPSVKDQLPYFPLPSELPASPLTH